MLHTEKALQYHLPNLPGLLDRISEGDETAFAVLFRELVPALQPAIRRNIGSEDGVNEVIQETFIRVWMNRDKLPGLEKPIHWIYRVAFNECYTWLRKEAVWEKHAVQMQSLAAAPERAHDRVVAGETRELIARAISQLTPQRRLIFQLHRDEGLPTAEIAARLRLSHSHVRNSLSEALRFIREYLIASGKVMS